MINSTRLYLKVLELLVEHKGIILGLVVNTVYISYRLSIERTRYRLYYEAI